jgi:hypothetical protein
VYKDLLSKEEIQQLLSDVPVHDSNARKPIQANGRSGGYTEITIVYLQQTVQELQREIRELQERLESLERLQGGSTPANAPEINKTQAAGQQGFDPKPNIPLSRAEKHRGGRGKWF